MTPPTVLILLRRGVIDPPLAALAWLLSEGGLPMVVTGPAGLEDRTGLAAALVSIDPDRAWLVIDADREAPTLSRLSSLLQGGAGLGICVAAAGVPDVLERLHDGPARLPYDAVRRLGVIVTLQATTQGPRCAVVHYLRPAERDAQGHVQRRPPAILASWDAAADRYDDYAWGILHELAERVGLDPARLEDRQRGRAAFLAAVARLDHISAADWQGHVRGRLAEERAAEASAADRPPAAPDPPPA